MTDILGHGTCTDCGTEIEYTTETGFPLTIIDCPDCTDGFNPPGKTCVRCSGATSIQQDVDCIESECEGTVRLW